MAKTHERFCNICGKSYKYCGTCNEYKHLPPYMLAWCSESCMKVDRILTNWCAKITSTEDAYNQLMTCDLSRLEFFDVNYKNTIEQLKEEYNKFHEKHEEKIEEKQVEEKPEIIKPKQVEEVSKETVKGKKATSNITDLDASVDAIIHKDNKKIKPKTKVE